MFFRHFVIYFEISYTAIRRYLQHISANSFLDAGDKDSLTTITTQLVLTSLNTRKTSTARSKCLVRAKYICHFSSTYTCDHELNRMCPYLCSKNGLQSSHTFRPWSRAVEKLFGRRKRICGFSAVYFGHTVKSDRSVRSVRWDPSIVGILKNIYLNTIKKNNVVSVNLEFPFVVFMPD